MDRELRRQIALERAKLEMQKDLEDYRYQRGVERDIVASYGRVLELCLSTKLAVFKWYMAAVGAAHFAYLTALFTALKIDDLKSVFRKLYVGASGDYLVSLGLLAAAGSLYTLWVGCIMPNIHKYRDRTYFDQKMNWWLAGANGLLLAVTEICVLASGFTLFLLIVRRLGL